MSAMDYRVVHSPHNGEKGKQDEKDGYHCWRKIGRAISGYCKDGHEKDGSQKVSFSLLR